MGVQGDGAAAAAAGAGAGTSEAVCGTVETLHGAQGHDGNADIFVFCVDTETFGIS